eukprot:TRINITY_DN41477_c0_g1_i1.p1 TRINITY_DN41477_c0_g1~~TRINITY_DN41477_c0_g1_i1.p1  ORF type:complete len:114 (-),score=7.49 TRINITY_DN41477_c0_g1_i1:2-343(-)
MPPTKVTMSLADANSPLSPMAIQQNMKIANDSRLITTMIAGAVTGILGLTGKWGFLAFVCAHLFTSAALLTRMGGSPNKYFISAWSYWGESIMGNLLIFILMWTLFYGIVFIY